MYSLPRPLPMPVRYASSTTSVNLDKPDHGLRLVRSLVDNGALGLKRLIELQNEGWNDTSTDLHFSRQRQTADTASTELGIKWFNRMKDLFGEIDANLNLVPPSDMVNFLDLGCCPGGFSSYILDKNVYASGVGVSLSTEDGGHEFLLEERHRSRYNLYSSNLTYLQLGPSIIEDRKLQDIPANIQESCFDLVLLDGHQLRTQASALPWDQERLLISQLILALQSVKEGGTIVVKLPLPHKLVAARVLYMLNAISSNISRWKPRLMHANRGTFYAVAKGIGKTQDMRSLTTFILQRLKNLWVDLTFGGEEGSGRHMVVEDMDFIVPIDDIISHHLDWLTTLGTPLWKVQEVALERLYSKNKRQWKSG